LLNSDDALVRGINLWSLDLIDLCGSFEYHPSGEFTHQCSGKPVTPFGGMAVMKRFIDQVGIREYLGELDLPEPGSNRDYTSAEILESFWLNIWTGASRYTHCN
jgi:hypothetical protein